MAMLFAKIATICSNFRRGDPRANWRPEKCFVWYDLPRLVSAGIRVAISILSAIL